MQKKFFYCCEARFRDFRDFFEARRDETRLTKNEIFRDRSEIGANLIYFQYLTHRSTESLKLHFPILLKEDLGVFYLPKRVIKKLKHFKKDKSTLKKKNRIISSKQRSSIPKKKNTEKKNNFIVIE